MIDVSELIHDPDFEMGIVILRTHGGKFVGSIYTPGPEEVLNVRGIIVNPKNSKEIRQTPQGDQATGYVDIYLDANTPVYTTRERENGNNISDVIVENYQTPYEVRYRVTNVFDRAAWGFYKASAVRMGAI